MFACSLLPMQQRHMHMHILPDNSNLHQISMKSVYHDLHASDKLETMWMWLCSFLFFFLRFFENGRIEQHIGQLWLVYRVLTMFCIFLIDRFSILFSCSILTGLNFIRIEQMRSSSKYRARLKKTNDASNSSNIIPAPPPPPQEQM